MKNIYGIAVRPKNTKIQSCHGRKYVYVTISSNYIKDKQYNLEKRKCIGEMINDNEMIINQFFKEYFPEVEIKSNKTFLKSKVVKIGIQTILKKIYEELKIDEYIKQSMDGLLFEGQNISNTIFNLASYMIINESSKFQYYPYFARNHYTMKSSIENDIDISRFIKDKISNKENILEFNRLWFQNNVNNDHIYMSLDGTNINNTAEGVTLKEYGAAKENEDEPVVSLSYLFNHTNNRPVSYDVYKGSIIDMAHIKGFLKKISNYGLEKVELILDRGYFSEKNINNIMKHCCGFLMMAKENNTIIREKIKEVKNNINSITNYISSYDIYGITIKGKLFKQDLDGEERYFHIYFDEKRKLIQKTNLIKELTHELKIKLQLIGTEYKEQDNKPFIYELDENNIILNVKLNEEIINQTIDNYGYFVLVSSNEISAEKAITIYRNRNEIEKIFMILKTHLDMSKVGVQSNESIRGKFFIAFIASILRNELFIRLKDIKQTDKKNYTVPSVIHELDDIEAILNSDEKYVLDTVLTKYQRKITNIFKVNASNFALINDELSDLVIRN